MCKQNKRPIETSSKLVKTPWFSKGLLRHESTRSKQEHLSWLSLGETGKAWVSSHMRTEISIWQVDQKSAILMGKALLPWWWWVLWKLPSPPTHIFLSYASLLFPSSTEIGQNSDRVGGGIITSDSQMYRGWSWKQNILSKWNGTFFRSSFGGKIKLRLNAAT